MPDKKSAGQSGSTKNVIAVIITIIILCVIGFLVWWFGWHETSNPVTNSTVGNNQTTQPTATEKKDKIRTNWTKFFDGSTPLQQRAQLLQNGQKFEQALKGLGQSKTAKETSATISNIELKSDKKASVNYTIDLNGQPALKNQTGQAVLVDGTWKVSAASACSLLQIAGSTPAMCQRTPSQQSTTGAQTQPSQQTQSSNQPQTKPGATNQSATKNQ